LNHNQEDTLIAIKAPIGAKIELIDPEEITKYFLSLGYSEESIKPY
jgi:hypothetical protein